MGMTIQVESTRLVQAQVQLSALAGDLQAGLDAVGYDVTTLLAQGWAGAAAASFEQAWRQWRAGLVQVIGALGDTAMLVLAGSQGYDDQENRTGAGFAQLASP